MRKIKLTENQLHYIIKESATGSPVYEIKQNKANIDFGQNYNDIIGTV